MLREVDPSSWRADTYRHFDGKPASSFDNTSVHLSFTDYHIQLYDGTRGGHDNQVSMVESVFSIRDKGRWVGDIDPLALVSSSVGSIIVHHGGVSSLPVIRRLAFQVPCSHAKESNLNQDIISVDSWEELLDLPEGIFVVRTGGNWIARLAATFVAFQQLRSVSSSFAITICPDKVCWICAPQAFQRHAYIF
jgi:hypothetical protein